ncbi:MAPEG family protein, partial [Accumulibacter sp.]|uniref:MAPEG family protein n=1 Tax=Accumulibacter sp. TaxID=2053492 RepID=UPI0028C3C2C6
GDAMNVPVWMLLGFAAWTVLLLLGTVGVYRWSLILAGRVPIGNFRADQVEGSDRYKRAMRAHANCIENLPVFGAIVIALHIGQVGGTVVDGLSAVIFVARMAQSLVHVGFVQTNAVTAVRFGFFFAQIVAFLCLIGIIVARLSGSA